MLFLTSDQVKSIKLDIAKAFSDNIKFIAERNEIKRSKADVYAAYFWLSWEPETDLFNWIKSIK